MGWKWIKSSDNILTAGKRSSFSESKLILKLILKFSIFKCALSPVPERIWEQKAKISNCLLSNSQLTWLAW